MGFPMRTVSRGIDRTGFNRAYTVSGWSGLISLWCERPSTTGKNMDPRQRALDTRRRNHDFLDESFLPFNRKVLFSNHADFTGPRRHLTLLQVRESMGLFCFSRQRCASSATTLHKNSNSVATVLIVLASCSSSYFSLVRSVFCNRVEHSAQQGRTLFATG